MLYPLAIQAGDRNTAFGGDCSRFARLFFGW